MQNCHNFEKEPKRILSNQNVLGKMFGDLASNSLCYLFRMMLCEAEKQLSDALFKEISVSALCKKSKKNGSAVNTSARAAIHPHLSEEGEWTFYTFQI